MPRIMGLDLSLSETGFATPEHLGVLKTPAKKFSGPKRLVEIRDLLLHLLREHQTEVVLLENYSFGSKNKREWLGELGGVIRVMLYEEGIPYVEVSPNTLKMYATGHGNAAKAEVISAARERLGYSGFNDNEADALWLRALGNEAYGEPEVKLPQTHRRALTAVEVPVLAEV